MSKSQRPRRLVSKSKYVQMEAMRYGIAWIGSWLFMGSIITGAIAIVCLFAALYQGEAFAYGNVGRTLMLAGALTLGIGCYWLGRLSFALTNHADTIASCVPLTQANIENLPAEESLVRGSEAPQTPAETLLRPTQATPIETPQQLLRASVSKSEGSEEA